MTPAMAVIAKLKKEGWEIFFIGRKHALEGDSAVSVEYKIIKELGIPFVSLIAGRFQRSLTRYTFFSLLKIPVGFIQSFYYLSKFKPSLILSFGGYLALPVALAGWILRIPIVTHEQSVVPGLATKIISRFARKVCVSWPQTEKWFSREKVILTGNPIRKEVFMGGVKPTHLRGVNLNETVPLIYITGGSLGAHAINEVVTQILPRLLEKYRIIHQCGNSQIYKDYENLLTTSCQLPATLRNRYFLTKYVESEDIGWVLNNADFVVSRAGANIITELAAKGLPAILIPLPWAGQKEQMENARLLTKAGTAVILPQEKLTGKTLYQCIESLIQNLEEYKMKRKEAQKLVNLEAGDKLVEAVKEVVNEEKNQKKIT